MVFTTDGKNNLINYLAGTDPTPPSRVAFGTGTATEADSDTALVTETNRILVDNTIVSNKQVKFSATLNSAQGNGNNLAEVGLFNASSGGTIFQRVTFNPVTKTSSIEVKATITLRIK